MQRRSHGFTLIELLVVLTVLGIMLGIGIPSFKNFTANQRVKSASYELSTSLLYARSEAIKRNTSLTVTPASGTDWTTGWSVAVSGTILQTQPSLTGVTITQTPAAAAITFQGTGRPTATAKTYWLIGTSTGASVTARCVALDTAGLSSGFSSSTGTSCP
jgi:type IV fimbrial biogenesis protein FimT